MFTSAKFHQHSISISFFPIRWLQNICHRFLSYLFRMESFANEKCILCKEEFETTPTSVQQKCYEILFGISRERSMLELTNDLINRKDSGQQILVHFDCRRKFTDTTKKSQSNQPSKKLWSSFDNAFNWKQHCFICAKPADTRHTNKSNIIKVMTLPLRDNLVVCAKERSDDWGKSVLGRLESCNEWPCCRRGSLPCYLYDEIQIDKI